MATSGHKGLLFLLLLICIQPAQALTRIFNCTGLQAMQDDLSGEYELAGDIDRTDEWAGVLEVRLNRWIESPRAARQLSGATLPSGSIPLRLAGLGGIADRMSYCRSLTAAP